MIISDDEDDSQQQETLGERTGPDGFDYPEEPMQENPVRADAKFQVLQQSRMMLYSNPYHQVIEIDIDD